MRPSLKNIIVIAALMLMAPAIVAAQGLTHDQAALNLRDVYHSRADLVGLFAEDFSASARAKAMGFSTLEDWAKRYGQKEYPELLGWYRDSGAMAIIAASTPPASEMSPQRQLFAAAPGVRAPMKTSAGTFPSAAVTASSYVIVDVDSNTILFSHKAQEPHPLASLTKLVTAMVALDRGVPMNAQLTMQRDDEVGGARLRVPIGTRIPARDLFYAMLVGSANNSANTLSRSTGISRDEFISAMNAKVAALGCPSTSFKDASGMNPENMSTPEEVAAIALKSFSYEAIWRMTSTQAYDVQTSEGVHHIKNTNHLLTNNANGLIVTGGKTGYLVEAGWNLVVRMRDASHPQLLVVVMGSGNQTQSFRDAAALARWTWSHYAWN